MKVLILFPGVKHGYGQISSFEFSRVIYLGTDKWWRHTPLSMTILRQHIVNDELQSVIVYVLSSFQRTP